MPQITCKSISGPHWEQAPESFIPGASVHVWRIQVSACAGMVSSLLSVLGPGEKERASTYPNEKDKHRFIICRGALRILLGKYTGNKPQDIHLTLGKNKKPFIRLDPSVDIQFNVAHSGDWILIAISDNPVGIDIEFIDGAFFYSEMLPVCFSKAEIDYITNSEIPHATFYLLWTRKEALVKASGQGIETELESVPCLYGTYNISEDQIGSAQDWVVKGFELAKIYVCSIAHSPQNLYTRFYETDELLLQRINNA